MNLPASFMIGTKDKFRRCAVKSTSLVYTVKKILHRGGVDSIT